jgi:ABC-type lipoprotein export system ATPase subunit
MNEPAIVIEARNLTKSYPGPNGPVHVLRGIGLTAHRGRMVCVIGPSGSGKTTLLGCLGGLLAPDEGTLTFLGRDLPRGERARARLRREHMAFVFQTGNLFPYLTAVQNAALSLILKRVPARQAHARAADLLTRLGLGERLRHYPDKLSGGERQRTALARAALSEADLLLADEPTGSLDEDNARQVAHHLLGLAREGRAVIVVSHNPLFQELADATVRLRGGRLEE